MADEKTDVSGSAEESAASGEPPKKKKGKAWLWIGIAVVAVAAGGAAGAFMMMGSGDEASTEQAAENGDAPDGPVGLLALDTFLVNLAGADGSEHYLKLTLRLGIAPDTKAAEIGQDDLLRARIRDRILTVLSSKSIGEVGGLLGKESLRREIQAQVNTLLGDGGQVQDVLFSEFVVQ